MQLQNFSFFLFFFAGIFHFLAFPAFFPLFPPFFSSLFFLFVPDGFLCPTSGTSHEGPEVPCPSSVVGGVGGVGGVGSAGGVGSVGVMDGVGGVDGMAEDD